MENIHSYEQRSSSELGHELHQLQNRVILVNRREPNSSWSAQNQPTSESQGFINWFKKLNFHLPEWLRCSRSNQIASLSSKTRSSSSFMDAINYDLGPFASNEWRTSKYTLITFLPKNLFEQFRRIANFYFLSIAILQTILPYSPVGPMTSVLPLMFVVATSAIKQAYEDYLRHKIDKEVNNRLCHVLRDKRLVKVRSKDIRVGDFVHVKNNEEIPCDMLLLAAGGHGDRCYITTANLDGESSLKGRTCFQIKEQLGSIDKLDSALLIVECETPNATLYEFNGYLRSPKTVRFYESLVSNLNGRKSLKDSFAKHEQQDLTIPQIILNRVKYSKNKLFTSKKSASSADVNNKLRTTDHLLNNLSEFHEIPLDISNLLLRASRLRNTSYIYGLAIYTGRDTKLAHNSHVKSNKFSSTESKVNIFLLMALILLLTFSLIGAINYRQPSNSSAIIGKLPKADSFGQIFMAHFLIYNYLMPISLYVTLEFVKFFGTLSVVDDKKMKVAIWKSLGAMSNESTLIKQSHQSMDHHLKQSNIYSKSNIHDTTPESSSLGSTKRVKIIEGPRCNSSDLNEELGQVEVLFSDKTGTLTENKMCFMACSTYGQLYRSVNDQLYLQPANLYNAPIPNVARRLAKVGSGRHILLSSASSTTGTTSGQQSSRIGGGHSKQQEPISSHKPFDHQHIPPLDKMKLVTNMDQQERLVEFFICLCLCSTITLNETLPLADCLPDKTANEYDFQSASPDEESLISAAHLYGVSMCKSNDQDCYIVIERSGQSQSQKHKPPKTNLRQNKFNPIVEGKSSTEKYIVRHFKRLQVFEFDSVRKRMSAIYRDCDNDCILMVTKGSEELLDCIKLDHLDNGIENCINVTLAHFEAFALSGLRTLLVARRVVSKQDYNQIEAAMREARQSIQNRDHLLSKLYQRAENELRLIGATAVEDTLQEGVPETIANLKEAGIKVWLLTGDKVETAISVAYLCRLLDREMTLFHLVRQQDVQSCQKLLIAFDRQLSESRGDQDDQPPPTLGHRKSLKSISPRSKSKTKTKTNSRKSKRLGPKTSVSEEKFALIADGRSLYYAMKYAKNDLAKLCKYCTCVLGCRLSPLQKAEVVDMLKQSDSKPITAAIGDGANDVSMIQEAHVGIGVSGKEGKQAINCSDFAISRFHMLNRLLFVHGHLFYHRTAHVIHYFFYKNILFMLPQFIFSFYSLSSAQSFYHPILLISFNLVFTSMPILLYGLYEIYIPEVILEHNPKLYRMNQGNRLMRLRVFFSWLGLGALQATIGFYVLYFNWGSVRPILESGHTIGLYGFSTTLYIVTILTATMRICFLSKYHTIYFNISTCLSILLVPTVFYAYSLIDWSFLNEDTSYYGDLHIFLRSPMFWLSVFMTTLATLVPDIILYIRERIVYFRELNSLMEHSTNHNYQGT